jgi:hypothetical protein
MGLFFTFIVGWGYIKFQGANYCNVRAGYEKRLKLENIKIC